MISTKDLRVFAGSSVPDLGRKICDRLDIELGEWKFLPQRGRKRWYSNGCYEVELEDNCRGRHIFIIQTSLPDVCTLHLQLFELFQLVMAASKSAANEITVVVPYLSYARSDKKTGRMPIVGKMVPNFLEVVGMDNFLGIEFHSDQYELAFRSEINVDAPTIFPQLIEHLKDLGWKDKEATVLPGDEGSREIAEMAGEALHLKVGTVEKARTSNSEVKIRSIKGDLEDQILIVDDEICGATTARAVAEKVVELGAGKEITIVTAHALFTGNAVEKLQYLPIKRIITTNTVPTYKRIDPEVLPLDVQSVAPFLASAIEEIQGNGSVSKLYKIPPAVTLEEIEWKLSPEFREILALEQDLKEKWLELFELLGINSRVMRKEHLGPYRDLLKAIVK